MALPVPAHALLGRERELEELRAWLDADARLLTLTGPAGVGKTSVAIAAARAAAPGFDDTAFVDLTALHDPSLLLAAIAAAFGVGDGATGAALALRRSLANGRRLVVLDNFEHLLDAASEVGSLVSEVPDLTVLVTSRERLGLLDEREYELLPLDLPDEHAGSDLHILRSAASVALFEERARAVQPRFEVTAEDAHAVAELVARLDGLPLAIELAAARMRLFTPLALLSRLDRRLDDLQGRERDRPERHRTLRSAIAWSYNLLSEEEARAFRSLAVFEAPSTLEALSAVAGEGVADPITSIESLIEKGLLSRSDTARPNPEARFRLLESIRAFAREQLEAEGEARAARRRHADYFLALAESIDPLLAGAWDPALLARASHDWPNFEAVVTYALEAEDREVAWRLAALIFYWWEHGQLSRVHRLQPVLDLIADLDVATEPSVAAVKVSYNAGLLASTAGDIDGALAYLERGRRISEAAGETRFGAWALTLRIWIAWITGDHAPLMELERLVDDLSPATDDWSLGVAHLALASLHQSVGDHRAALARFERALPLLTRGTEVAGSGFVHVGLCRHHRWRGDLDRARDELRLGLDAFRAQPDLQTTAYAIEEAVHLGRARLGDDHALSLARLVGAAERQRNVVRVPRATGLQPEWLDTREAVRAALDLAAYEAATDEGARWSVSDALDEARSLIDLSPTSDAATAPPLTPRELEVAALIGRGMTSPEIAEELVISENTANTHAAHIREKLDLRSRAEIAAWAARRDLTGTGDPAD